MRICSVEECNEKQRRNGLCDKHDQRMKRTGTTDDPPRLTLADRFWSKVDRRGPNECWPWAAARNEHGYGVMRPEGQRTGPAIKAHRVALIVSGVDLGERHALHSCDNPICVNPNHLRPGDPLDNARDRVDRGQQPRGSRVGSAKLTEQQVIEIRAQAAAGVLHREIAQQYGISRSHVTYIKSRKGWTHVG